MMTNNDAIILIEARIRQLQRDFFSGKINHNGCSFKVSMMRENELLSKMKDSTEIGTNQCITRLSSFSLVMSSQLKPDRCTGGIVKETPFPSEIEKSSPSRTKKRKLCKEDLIVSENPDRCGGGMVEETTFPPDIEKSSPSTKKRKLFSSKEALAILELTKKLGTHHWALFSKDKKHGGELQNLTNEQIRQYLLNIKRHPRTHPEYAFLNNLSFQTMEKSLQKILPLRTTTKNFNLDNWYGSKLSKWNEIVPNKYNGPGRQIRRR